jgi:putative ABC transport system substrate-binding protein
MQRRRFITLVGGGMALPLVARAQQPSMPVIGFLNGGSPHDYAPYLAGFHRGLKEAGFTEGKNVSVEYRWADGQYDRLPRLADDLVGRSVSVIAANTKIPIVFVTGDDPVESGMVKSLSRPGGNLTGVTLISSVLGSKQVGLLRELAVARTSIAFLLNPNNSSAVRNVSEAKNAAQSVWQRVLILHARTVAELEAAFTTMAQEKVETLVVEPDAFLISRRDQIVALAARYAVPTMYQFRDYALAGGLMSYGANLSDQYRQVGLYTGMILKGAHPADLPVLQPTRFELVINLKTAKTLGLTLSPGLLALTDEVIE